MTFNELCEEVALVLGRPDLSAEISSAVRQATLKAHHSDHYYRDLQELTIDLGEPAQLLSVRISEVLPAYRSMRYIRLLADDGTPTKILTNIDVEDIFDECARLKSNVYYVAGDMLHIRCSGTFDKVIVGYYSHPNTTAAKYASWVAAEYPYVIINEAIAAVLNMIGSQEQAAAYRRLYAEGLQELRANCIVVEGS